MPKSLTPYILIGLVASLDNLGVGLSLGLRRIKIPFTSNLMIGLLSGMVSALFVTFGNVLSGIVRYANTIGAVVLVFSGFIFIFPDFISYSMDFCRNNFTKTRPETRHNSFTLNPQPPESSLSFSQSVMLGVVLALNCISTGLGAGLTGLGPLQIAFWATVLSMVAIELGAILARRTTGNVFSRWAQPLSGLILVMIGIYDLLF